MEAMEGSATEEVIPPPVEQAASSQVAHTLAGDAPAVERDSRVPLDTGESNVRPDGGAQPTAASFPPSALVESEGEQATPAQLPVETTEQEKAWFHVLPAYLKQFKNNQYWQIKQIGIPLCTPCLRNGKRCFANVSCVEEGCAAREVPSCGSCFEKQHATEREREHGQILTTACPHCHTDQVTYWCLECDLSFCAACHADTHDGVPTVANHRRVCTDNTPGSLLVRANWSSHFRAAVLQRLHAANDGSLLRPAAKQGEASAVSMRDLTSDSTTQNAQQVDEGIKPATPMMPPSASLNGVAAGAKRKRVDGAIEVICVDDDDDDDDGSGENSAQQRAVVGSGVTSFNGASRSMDAAANAWRYTPIGTVSVTTSNSLGTTSNNSNAAFTSAQPLVQMQRNAASGNTMHTSALNPNMAVPTSVFSSRYTHTAPLSSAFEAIGNGINGNDSETQFSDVTPSASTNNGSTMALDMTDNPLENALFDRLDKLNEAILQTEQQINLLNNQIIHASYRDTYSSQSAMVKLQERQTHLAAVKKSRDETVVQMVMKSPSIFAQVKLIQVSFLGDITQVQNASYLKCLQFARLMGEARKEIDRLNQEMARTLDNVSLMNAEVFHRTVSALNQRIQVKENMIRTWKYGRVSEIVRVVQYSAGVRDSLKRVVSRHMQQQQLHPHQEQLSQQQQQQQRRQRMQRILQQQQQQQERENQQRQQQQQQRMQQRLQQLHNQQHQQFVEPPPVPQESSWAQSSEPLVFSTQQASSLPLEQRMTPTTDASVISTGAASVDDDIERALQAYGQMQPPPT